MFESENLIDLRLAFDKKLFFRDKPKFGNSTNMETYKSNFSGIESETQADAPMMTTRIKHTPE
jgi:hypothetical protein